MAFLYVREMMVDYKVKSKMFLFINFYFFTLFCALSIFEK